MEKQLKNIIRLLRFAVVLSLIIAVTSIYGLLKKPTTDTVTTTAAATSEASHAEATTAAAMALTESEIRLALGDTQSAWDGNTANLTDQMKATVSMYYKTQGNPVQYKENWFYFVTDETATVAGDTTGVTGATSSAVSNIPTATTNTTTQAANAIPTTKAEILAAYTTVMNKVKTEKPGFSKYMYQALPDSEKYKDDTTVKLLMGIVNRFMTTKEKAMKNPVFYSKGTDTKANFPITESAKGCMLTDTSAIKSAKCEPLSNGNYKITIILNNETNPERFRDGMDKAPSNTGNMFVIFSKSDVDPILNEWYVTPFVKDTNLTMTFHDCKAELEYNPKTSQIATLDQVTSTSLEVGGTVVGKRFDNIKTELDMYYSASNFQY